jgi:eukaryotic-like serine/threonine-protein kinase
LNRVGRYEITEKLGQGGMGTVYKAFDPLLTRVVAVKVISGQLDANPDHRERFFREARAAAQLSHRNIITIYDLGEQDGAPYLAMEYLEGRDLDQRLHDGEGMSLTRKLELALSICEGLAHAHACGLIHRDIKPANIFVTDDGGVKILDFGLARLITSELTRSNVMVGTVNYMAPEQLRGERPDHRADIFSFGVLLYELLGGRKPFQGDSAAATMYKILHEVPKALDELDAAVGPVLTTLVDRAMAKAREDRYQRMTDLLRDLEAAYEPMRGADRRVISRVEAALGTPPSSRATPLPGDYNPDNSPTISDETVPLPPPAFVPDAPVAPAPSQVTSRRGWLLGVPAIGLLLVGAWFVANREATSPAPATAPSAQAPQPAPPAPPLPAPPAAAPTPDAVAAPDNPAPPPAPRPDPPARTPRPVESPRDAAAAVDRTHAASALAQMDAGKAAAEAANARELAPQLYAAAEREETRARDDLRQQRFAVAAARMESTATLFRSAAAAADAETQAAAARARAAEEGRRRADQVARQTPPPPAPAPALPPPLPAPAPPTAPAPAQPSAQEAVAAALRRYTSALEQRDVTALKAVWPGLSRSQQEAVEADFANARSISVELASPRIDVSGATATVNAVRHYSLRTRDGQQLRSDTATTLTLRQGASGWLIESVSHRPLR